MTKAHLTSITAAAVLAGCSQQPARQVSAVVVSIAEHANPKWDADQVVVTARSEDGAMGSKPVLQTRLKCRIGDTVHGVARGVALKMDDRACEQ
jgi:hypothetical protein